MSSVAACPQPSDSHMTEKVARDLTETRRQNTGYSSIESITPFNIIMKDATALERTPPSRLALITFRRVCDCRPTLDPGAEVTAHWGSRLRDRAVPSWRVAPPCAAPRPKKKRVWIFSDRAIETTLGLSKLAVVQFRLVTPVRDVIG
jgi:hypothetical protein